MQVWILLLAFITTTIHLSHFFFKKTKETRKNTYRGTASILPSNSLNENQLRELDIQIEDLQPKESKKKELEKGKTKGKRKQDDLEETKQDQMEM